MGKSRFKDEQFGKYQLIRSIGHGSFAEVYLGEHVTLNTQAAIKILDTRLSNFDKEDFLIEARTIANLKHPHIVRVYDHDVHDRYPYLVMDYAPNGSIRHRYPKGTQLPLSVITLYVKQVASALQYAHDRNLIHRDVKPDNMLLDGNFEILLSDFGLAAIARSSIKNAMAGTPNYMAPEQIKGKPCKESDQYALGIAVYEWISGSRPFNGSQYEIILQHQNADPPPLSKKVPWLSTAVEQVVLRALSKNPADRYPSITQFADYLEQAINSQTYLHQPLSEEPSSGIFSFRRNNPTEPIQFFDKKESPGVTPQVPHKPVRTKPKNAVTRRNVVRYAIGLLAVLGGGTIATTIVVSCENRINSSAGVPLPSPSSGTAKSSATNAPRSTATNTPQPTTSSTPQANATVPPSLPPPTNILPKLNGNKLAEDTFHRSNQSHWGTASDGRIWQGDANSVSNFSIVSDKGQVTGSGAANSAAIGQNMLNSEVVLICCASAFPSSGNETYQIGPVLRWRRLPDGDYFYKAFIDGKFFNITKGRPGLAQKADVIMSKKFIADRNTWYTIRFRITSASPTTLQASVWRTDMPESSALVLMGQDPEPTLQQAGQAGFRPQTPKNVTAQISYFCLTTG